MKHHFILFTAISILMSSCSKSKGPANELLPISEVMIDSLSIEKNGNVFVRIRSISSLSGNVGNARSVTNRTEGDTIAVWKKYVVDVPDSLHVQLGKYEMLFRDMNGLAGYTNKVFRLQYWQDSVTTINTIVKFRSRAG